MSERHRAWIALGSNILPEVHLPAAVQALESCGEVTRVSQVWESPPLGFLEQPRFCNAAVLLETAMTPAVLRETLRTIESKLGRVRDPANKNGPRTIDLDIALFDDAILREEGVEIPDPEISTRPFLAIPLAELTPEFQHPQTGASLKDIADQWTSATSGLTPRTDVRLALLER